MIHYRPLVAARTRIAKHGVPIRPRPQAELHPIPRNFDPVAYAAVLEGLG